MKKLYFSFALLGFVLLYHNLVFSDSTNNKQENTNKDQAQIPRQDAFNRTYIDYQTWTQEMAKARETDEKNQKNYEIQKQKDQREYEEKITKLKQYFSVRLVDNLGGMVNASLFSTALAIAIAGLGSLIKNQLAQPIMFGALMTWTASLVFIYANGLPQEGWLIAPARNPGTDHEDYLKKHYALYSPNNSDQI
jgi:hypothetical protein